MAREIYVEEGYRVAPLFRRFVAGVVDLAFAFLFSMLLFLVIYPHGNWGTLGQAIGMSETWDTLNVYRASSGLMQDKDGNILHSIEEGTPQNDIIADEFPDDFVIYKEAVEYYYFTYQTGDVREDNPDPSNYVKKVDGVIVDYSWYNVNVLGLPEYGEVNHSNLFKYHQTGEGPLDYDVKTLGEYQDHLYEQEEDGTFVLDEEGNRILTYEAKGDLYKYYNDAYTECFQDLTNRPFFQSLEDSYYFDFIIVMCLIIYPSVLIFYLVIPIFSKTGSSLGKRVCNLGLIKYDGMMLPKWGISLRVLPLVFVILVMLILDDFVLSFSFLLLIFLISITTGLLTKKRRWLHDYCALSVVTERIDSMDAYEREKGLKPITDLKKENDHA